MKNTNKPNKAPALKEPVKKKSLPVNASVAIGAAGEWKTSVDLTLVRHGQEISEATKQRKYVMDAVLGLSKNMVDITKEFDDRMERVYMLCIVTLVVSVVSIGAAILAYAK